MEGMKRERERWREYYQGLVDEKREREMEGILPGAGG